MNLVRVVCDTNVLVSALLGSSTNRRILEIFETSQIVLLFTRDTLAELAEVLRRPELGISASEIRLLFQIIRKRAGKVRVGKTVWHCRDPKDDIILNVAYYGKPDFLITGDKDILAFSHESSLKILTPAKFLELFGD